jgi:hypothetical protein
MIKEELLHYLWRTHRIPKIGLQTTDGHFVEILNGGILNHGDGPDFSNARIRIDNMIWSGPVEMHLKSSDWYAHNHQRDSRYNNVVLHVVLEENEPVYVHGRRLPCVEIQKFVDAKLIHHYQLLQNSHEALACGPYEIQNISESFMWMRDKLISERLENSLKRLDRSGASVQQIFFTLFFGALGAKANKEPFMELAKRTNWAQIARWKHKPERLFCYLMLLSGLFETHEIHSTELSLIKQYVSDKQMRREDWQTRGIRPPSQPKKRLLELCLVLQHELCTPLFESQNAFEFNEAWMILLHTMKNKSQTGVQWSDFTLNNLAINAIAPFAFYKGVQTGSADWFDYALVILDEWPAEQNNIVQLYKNKALNIKTSGDSQALLELYKNYCTPKKCVSCAIGTTLLRA